MRQRRHGIGVARVFGVLFPGLGVGFADDDGGHGVDLDVLAPAAGVLDLFAQRGDDVTHRRLRRSGTRIRRAAAKRWPRLEAPA